VRSRIEALLREKKLDRTIAGGGAGAAAWSREERESRLLASGWASVDRALGGGFPRGECSEIVGSSSSGRTALLMTVLTEATRRGEIVALVDTLDRFDPRSAVEMVRHSQSSQAPLDLSRLLWVRGTPLSPQALSVSSRVSARPQARMKKAPTARSLTPRGLVRWEASADETVDQLDRVIARALKSFGLIAQAGGFGVVALDFADVPMPALRRLPFTTWFRLQRLIEGRDTVGIVLAPEPLARSARGITVRLDGQETSRVIWAGASDYARVLTGFAVQPQAQAARRLGDQLRAAASA